ncbi:MAG: hydroxysqualene dehydroxylase HpnE [Thermoguttaceae bacterium]|nr:hydroxysqualene dehydroxylase HpnE [Thermoguttaceae bacterium]
MDAIVKHTEQTGGGQLSVAVVGGGLAGISSAVNLVKSGCRVVLFERGRYLGGRTSSMAIHRDQWTSSQLVDNGQHIYLGCCHALEQMNATLNLESCFDRLDRIPFAQPKGKIWYMSPARWLPAQWQLIPSLLRMPRLTFGQRLHIIKTAKALLRCTTRNTNTETFGQWLARHDAPENTLRFFWQPIILSSLAELPDYVSVAAAQTVIREILFSGRGATSVMIPNRPLREIYHDRTVESLQKLGVDTRCLSRVSRLLVEGNRASAIELNTGETLKFDCFVLALGTFALSRLLNDSGQDEAESAIRFDRFELGAITAVHLWFDKRLIDDPAVVLFDGPGQWLFCPGKQTGYTQKGQGVYHQVIVSASHRLLDGDELTASKSDQLMQRVLQQLKTVFPEAALRELKAATVSTVLDAIVSPTPEVFSSRPSQETSLDNLVLAGDWTDTSWSSTMEGAVQSGIAAAQMLKRKSNPSQTIQQ